MSKRPLPKISDAQLRNLRIVSHYEASVFRPPTLEPLPKQKVYRFSGFELPRSIERLFTWFCLLCLLLCAVGLTAIPIHAVIQGEALSSSKGGGRWVQLSSKPVAFWVAVFISVFMAMVAWMMLVVAWNQTDRER